MKQLTYGNDFPKVIELSRFFGMPVYTINYGLHETGNPEIGKYCWNSVKLPPGHSEYETIVSSLITNEYDNNAMQAIMLNYLDNVNPDAIIEWKKMQQFRIFAKQLAKDFIDGKISIDTTLTL